MKIDWQMNNSQWRWAQIWAIFFLEIRKKKWRKKNLQRTPSTALTIRDNEKGQVDEFSRNWFSRTKGFFRFSYFCFVRSARDHKENTESPKRRQMTHTEPLALVIFFT